MSAGYWLGVDIGTGGSRALLVDETGRIAAARTAVHEDMRMDKPLWAEFSPPDPNRPAVTNSRSRLATVSWVAWMISRPGAWPWP